MLTVNDFEQISKEMTMDEIFQDKLLEIQRLKDEVASKWYEQFNGKYVKFFDYGQSFKFGKIKNITPRIIGTNYDKETCILYAVTLEILIESTPNCKNINKDIFYEMHAMQIQNLTLIDQKQFDDLKERFDIFKLD